MKKIMRIGAVEYLNTKPLIEGLDRVGEDVELSLELPSRLADRLAADELDVALIPVIEYFRAGRYSILPDIAIGSRGPVLSVTLFSRVPWDRIRSVSLDVGSRTSAALTQILLRERHGIVPEVRPLWMDTPADAVTSDAVLLIGDRAMHACLPGFEFAYDLGQEWTDWTGLPMVFAVWAVRPGVDLVGRDQVLHEAKRLGMARTGTIAQRESAKLGLDAGFCRRYLSNIIRFDLGPAEEAGLRRFYHLAANIGLAPKGVDLVYYRDPAHATSGSHTGVDHSPNLVESR